jgi:hypothetical protein
MALIPNDELVAKAWLVAAVSSLTAAKVATTLPDPPWTDNEFVQIMQVGGTPDTHLPIFEPVVSVNCFALKSGSTKPPWGQANHLASKILAACYDRRPATATMQLTISGYGGALVRSVWAVSQPRRIQSDPSQYAVYNLDLQFSWVASSEVYT